MSLVSRRLVVRGNGSTPTLSSEPKTTDQILAKVQRPTQVTCRLRLIESREVEEIRDLLELRQGKGARWFEQI